MEVKMFIEEVDKFDKILPKIYNLSEELGVKVNVWEIDQTITALSYLSHNYFRYYGKFPSTVAAQLIKDYPAPKDGVLLDNFMGSGTSLVEASRKGINSVGIDVNPLSILAGKVKTKFYDTALLRAKLKEILAEQRNPESELTEYIPEKPYLEKWFFNENLEDLIKLKSAVLALGNTKEAEFFILAFLSIIRRTSKAYDGEVRPHINKLKKIRDPFSAFSKKVLEMISVQNEFQDLYPLKKEASVILADAQIDYSSNLPEGNYWLVISHPPYLNCFDYLPVFKLELEWASGFPLDEEFINDNYKKKELKSWPASEKTTENYYDGLKKAYEITYKIQPVGGILAVVIGDCTIKGKLEPVHKKLINIIEGIGYKNIEINYRTTHYSTGKYSYKHRADYHGETEEKKDAILIFKK